MKILALDLSSHTGWCVYDNTFISSGSWALGSDTIDRMLALRSNLDTLYKEHKFDLLSYERVDFSRFTMAHAVYNQLLAVVLLWTIDNKVKLFNIPVKALKKLATGNGNADKLTMIAAGNAAWGTNYIEKNNDEVDARWLAFYTNITSANVVTVSDVKQPAGKKSKRK